MHPALAHEELILLILHIHKQRERERERERGIMGAGE